MNPVTLKELRQLTRSRTIAGAIVGFFLVQLLAAALVVVAETNSHGALDDDCGEMVFAWLAALLGPILALGLDDAYGFGLIRTHAVVENNIRVDIDPTGL